MTTDFGHNGLPDADRIAEYIEHRAERFSDRAAKTGNPELRSRATTLNAVASDIRAHLFEDWGGLSKGERRIVKGVRPYAEDPPVAVSIRSVSRWFGAWVAQTTTSYPVLTKRTKITGERLTQFSHRAEPSPAEVELLAAVGFVTPEGLRHSIDQAKGGE